MPKTREITRLHHKTVSNHQDHKKKRVSAARTTRTRTTSNIKVDPRVWKEAMKLSGGDRSRIKVESSTSVVVINISSRKK